MKIILVPSAYSAEGLIPDQNLTSYLINGTIAIDAGAIGFFGSPAEQARIRHIFLSHSHIDHLASLPSFLENTVGLSPTPVTIHASEAVQQALRLDMFNDRLWPNFLTLTHKDQPFVQMQTIENGQTVTVDGLRITAIAVDHVVPTLGFLIEDAAAAVLIPSDTGPTEEIWRRGNLCPKLKAVFLEAAFPNDHAWLATISKHLTTNDFAAEVKKVKPPVKTYAVHLKAQFRDRITAELAALGLAHLEVARFGAEYEI